MIKKSIFLAFVICFFVQINVAQKHTVSKNTIIKIGLLIENNNSAEAKNAAQLAINKENKDLVKSNIQFQLVTKSMEGPWGTGSKQAVDLIFKDDVWAILGSHNGQNGHLVEMVVAKMHTIFLSAWASDPTLSEAFVPWYFNCVPNDNQQANAIINEIYIQNKSATIALISETNYDANIASTCFLDALKNKQKSVLLHLNFENDSKDYSKIISQVTKSNCAAVVILGEPEGVAKFLQQANFQKTNKAVYVSSSAIGETNFSPINEQVYKKVTKSNWNNFLSIYNAKYKSFPSATAAYAFDGMNILINAIKKSGYNRSKLQQLMATSKINSFTGITGFDKNGNRIGKPAIFKLTK